MNTKTCHLLFLCLGAVAALPAQTLFSDSLATDASNWIVSPANSGGGATAFTASALTYSVGSPTADDRGYRTLNTYAASSTSSWSVQVDMHLAALSGLTTDQYANLNLMVVKASNPNLFNTSFALDRYNAGSVVRDIDTFVMTNGVSNQLTEVLTATTDATLRITYDHTLAQLTYDYDSDGAAGGATFLNAHTVDITAWSMSGAETFAFLLVGSSGHETAGLGPVISSADAYFQNFAVTAVPETSTYALLAGALALGVVIYRRRR
jgi:hypothetical protein